MATNPNLGEDEVDKGVKKALVIGVSNYEDESLDPLPFCKNDAEEMYTLLTSPELGFEIPDSNKMVGNVKDKEMKKAIVKFFKDPSITSQDTLLFYFAGHGVTDNSGEVFMASSEIDSKEPFNGGFPFRQLTKWMNESYSTRIITTLDCCHSGAFELATGGRGDPNEAAKKAHNDMEDKSNSLKQGRGKCLIAASESTQRAYEIKEKNHGIFTYYLLEGLKGKRQCVDEDGNVTVDRLADYVYDAISSLPPEKKPNQMPIRKAEGGGRIFLAYHPDLAKRQLLMSVGQTPQKEDSILQFIEEARMFLEQEQYDKAIKTFDGILMLRSGHIEALNGKGVALCKQKKYEAALECFKEVLQIKPRHTDASVYVDMITDRLSKEHNGETKASGKDIKQDMAALEKRTEKKVIEALNEATHIPTGLIKKGDDFLQKGMYQDAILCYEEALKIEPGSEKAWYSKGLALAKLARFSEAIECFNKALEINPKYAEAWFHEGIVHRYGYSSNYAIECFNKALEINPKYAEAWYEKGITIFDARQYTEYEKIAIECFNKALEINPKYAEAWFHKGKVLVRPIGYSQNEQALECFNKALEINPKYDEAGYEKGMAQLHLGRYEQALECFNKALEINPKYAEAWYKKGITLMNKLDRAEEAIACYDKAIAIDINGNNGDYWWQKGAALEALGRKKEAKECRKKAYKK